jgi:hypothetical protein
MSTLYCFGLINYFLLLSSETALARMYGIAAKANAIAAAEASCGAPFAEERPTTRMKEPITTPIIVNIQNTVFMIDLVSLSNEGIKYLT